MSKKLTLNIPNILTIIRILLVPFAVTLAVRERMTAGVIVYIAACATDVLDGIIARRFDMITDAGKLLDPLADKMMIIAMVITFTVMGMYPLFVVLVIVIKELLMIAGGVFLLNKEIVVHANIIGKLAALLTHLSIGFAFLHQFYREAYLYLMYAAIALTVFSFFQYGYLYLYKTYLKGKQDSEEQAEKD